MARYRFDSIDKMPFRAPDAWPADLPIPGILPAYSIVRAYGRYFGTTVTDAAPGQLVEVAIDGVMAEMISPIDVQPLGNERPLIREKGAMPKASAFQICEDLELIYLNPDGDIDVPGVVLEADEARGTYTWMIVSGGFGPPIDSAIAGKADKAYVDARDDELEEAISTKLEAAAFEAAHTVLEQEIGARQAHSASLDELAAIDPSETGKNVLKAADAAAARLAIGAQEAATALQYKVGQLVEFSSLATAQDTAGFLPADGRTLYNKVGPYAALAAKLAAANNPAGNFVKKVNNSTYTTPSGGNRTLTKLGNRLFHIAQPGSSTWYPYTSDDNGDTWTTRSTVNYYSVLGNTNPKFVIAFNGRIHVLSTSGSYTSSADGLTNFTAVAQLVTIFGAPVTAISINTARVLDNRLWIAGSWTGGTTSSFVAYLDQAGNWVRCATTFNRPIADIARKPGGTIVTASTGGEFISSDDEGATWTARVIGMNVTEALTVCIWSPTHNSFLWAGASGRSVTSVSGKDGFIKDVISTAISSVFDLIVAEGVVIAACSGSGLDGRGRLHVSNDLMAWSFRLVAGSEEVNFVTQVIYSSGRFILNHNGTTGQLGYNVISASDIPTLDAATQFFIPAATPSGPGWVPYVKF